MIKSYIHRKHLISSAKKYTSPWLLCYEIACDMIYNPTLTTGLYSHR